MRDEFGEKVGTKKSKVKNQLAADAPRANGESPAPIKTKKDECNQWKECRAICRLTWEGIWRTSVDSMSFLANLQI